MAELITATVRALPVRRSGDSLNIPTECRTALSPFRPVNWPHRERVRQLLERNRHAPDRANWGMVRPAFAARGSCPRGRRASSAAEHGKLVLRVRQRRADDL